MAVLPAKDNGVPNGLITGLVGLAIESRTIPRWAKQLSDQEAALAASYALQEMNGFSDWTVDLLNDHSDAFDKILRQELRWEFGLSEGEQSAPVHYTLAQLRYSGPSELRSRFCPYILKLLKRNEPWFDQTLEHSLSILLQWDELDTTQFAAMARKRYFETIDERRSLTWLVALLCVDADNALVALTRWLSVKEVEKRRERITHFCGAMGHHNFERFGSKYRDFERIEILRQLVPLIYTYIRIEDDNVHDGAFTPDARDNAESMRGYLLGRVCDTPGRQAFETLLEFSRSLPHKRSRERMQVIALRRAAADAEFPSWGASDIINFALEGGKIPSTHHELFELVSSRLDDIKYDLEDGDYSIAATLKRVDQETELRNWFVNSLRTAARGKYSASPEEELADAKRPDIRVHVPAIDAPCVIELKISDNWSYGEHIERLNNQLAGQYLRDARSSFGVFLLVRRQKRHWRCNRLLNFEELVECVQYEADRIVLNSSDLNGIKVIGIDLMKRHLKT